MPIEDLEFLYQNSVKENIIILVDSARRDRNQWLEPNEFQIDFVEPFKYVYGVEILDLNIPRTVYGVDDANNTLIIYILSSSTGHYEKITILLESRDYTIQELIENINAQLSANTDLLRCQISMESAVDENRKSILELISSVNDTAEHPKPFYIDVQASSLGSTIGFDSISQDVYNSDYIKIPSTTFKYGSHPSINNDIDENNKYLFGSFVNQYTTRNETLNLQESIETQYTYQYTFVNNSDIPTEHFITKIAINWIGDIPITSLKLYNTTKVYDITLQQIESDVSLFEVDVNDAAFIFDTLYINKSTTWWIQSVAPINKVDVQLITFTESKLISPGIVTLLGDRYVTIHCDEIENHLKGSLMFNTYSPGLALVNLGVLGYSQTRNDFYSVNYKEFHPIGKLNNLKFSVKNPKGELYNFRNVNWHMLLCVKFFVPKQKHLFTKSILNPNYNLDYVQYQIDKNAIYTHEQDDDDDDESEVSDKNEHIKSLELRYQLSRREEELRQDLNNLHYSSSDESSYETEDDD